jgi:hypothetical protein
LAAGFAAAFRGGLAVALAAGFAGMVIPGMLCME